MNHTTNYKLNQWEKDDRIQMEDFNADNAKIDGAIKGTEERLEQAVAEKCEVIAGTYKGDGAASRNIHLGRKPKAVFLCLEDGLIRVNSLYYGGLAMPGAPAKHINEFIITVTDTGFTVYHNRTSSESGVFSNNENTTFHYIAFF